MRSIQELLRSNVIIPDRDALASAVAAINAASGGTPIPNGPFAAHITGIAKPLHVERDSPNQVLITPYPACTDPVGVFDCSTIAVPDVNGLFPPEFLPCGIWPMRYRWKAEWSNLTSELCGWLEDTTAGTAKLWRQAFYAINVSHWLQERQIDYRYVKPGMLVQMFFTDISAITGGNPKWGFAFSHMTDPVALTTCPIGGEFEPDLAGCCHIFINGIEVATQCVPDAAECQSCCASPPIQTATFDGPSTNCVSQECFQVEQPVGCCVLFPEDGSQCTQACLTEDDCTYLRNSGQYSQQQSYWAGANVGCEDNGCNPGGAFGCGSGGTAAPKPGLSGTPGKYVVKDHKLARCVQ